MPIRQLERSRAVEITYPKYGSGYRIGGRLVLTAAHLFEESELQPLELEGLCKVRSKDDFDTVDAKLVWRAHQADVALVQLPDSVAPLEEEVVFGFFPPKPQYGTVSFDMYAWPKWARTEHPGQQPKSGGRHITGKIYLADTSPEGYLVFEPERTSQAPLSGESDSQWEGASGAAVICNGFVIAVQRQHQNPKRPASLEAQSLSAIYNDSNWKLLLKKHGIKSKPQKVPAKFFDEPRLGLSSTAVSAGCIAILIYLIRWLGLIQPFELLAYDLLLSARPALAKHDEHVKILGIEIEESEISDQQLQTILEKLNSPESRPLAVGVDIYRGGASDSLKQFLQDEGNQNIISACLISRKPKQDGQPPFLGISSGSIGFTDTVPDLDEVIRRHTLTIPQAEIKALKEEITAEETDIPFCDTPVSLSMRLVQKYLEPYDIKPQGGRDFIQLGEVRLNLLEERAGGYQRRNDGNNILGAGQIMLNFRPLTQAQRTSFEIKRYDSQGLERLSSSDLTTFKDKIVLIGYTSLDWDKNDQELYRTPRGYDGLGGSENPDLPEYGRIPGVLLHAHMVSQITNAVLEGRPLIWVLPEWVSFLWIFSWSSFVGLLAWIFSKPWQRFFVFTGGTLLLTLTCYLSLLLVGGWLPLIPPFLALSLMSLTIWIYSQIKQGN